jgi:hypothetical protein
VKTLFDKAAEFAKGQDDIDMKRQISYCLSSNSNE